jgi:putative hemolysin
MEDPSRIFFEESNLEYPIFSELFPEKILTSGEYQAHYAQNIYELELIKKLRFNVFRQELQDDPAENGVDEDEYDMFCHHIMVTHIPSQKLVGTYRLQTNDMANNHIGFYSNQEFQLEKIPKHILNESIELGRACVNKEHRNGRVLKLLLKGLGIYLTWNKKRYAFGCSSIFSQDMNIANAALSYFKEEGCLDSNIFVDARSKYKCIQNTNLEKDLSVEIPKLLKMYILLFNAKICSQPAIDKDFKTIDFLTLCDVRDLNERVFNTYCKI